ncbi:MAG: Uma2 family endonuclease [Armatimonadota bacterium]|nr:Uma2 family endonuclease [Armatimonadota bacterium]
MATRARLTARDLWERGKSDLRLELVNGQIVEMPPPGGLHGRVTVKIASRLDEYVRQHGGGEVVAGDVGFVLHLPTDPERVRGPDVAFISTRRLPEGQLPEGFVEGAPDLAVEVLSQSDNPVDVQQKVRDWLEGGARLVWVVAPQARTVTVYRPDGSARLLRDQEMLEGEQVLPGLTIPLGEVF